MLTGPAFSWKPRPQEAILRLFQHPGVRTVADGTATVRERTDASLPIKEFLISFLLASLAPLRELGVCLPSVLSNQKESSPVSFDSFLGDYVLD
jgi:hypothetical protein